MAKAVLEKKWEETQKKTFTKWCNMHLGKRGLTCEDISNDYRDGIKLVTLLEVIGADALGKINKSPKMKIHHIQNVNVALEYLKSKDVKLISISAEDIVDGNLKLTLGMIWTIILRFQIADISEEELSAKEALLLWCKKKCAPYGVPIDNFTGSWQSGLGWIALIHAHRPDLIPDPRTLSPEQNAANVKLAFDVAERDLGIPQLLDVEDVVDVPKPDERSVMTYVALYYHKFASSRKAEVAARRVGKLVDLTQSNDALKDNYNQRAAAHAQWVRDATSQLEARDFDDSLDGIKRLIDDFNRFKQEERPPKQAERLALEHLNNSIALKLANAGRPAFRPAAGLSVPEIGELWSALDAAQHARNQALLDELARQNRLDLLKRRFNSHAKRLEDWNHKQGDYLRADEVVESINEAQTRLMTLDAFDSEYRDSKPRVDDLQQLAASIAEQRDPEAAQYTARSDAIAGDWRGHQPLADNKRQDLLAKLKRQQEMEALRKRFAEDAKEYKRWEKSAEADVRDDTFGNTLEAVESHAATLASDDTARRGDNDAKQASLDDTWAQLQALGVTENRYTVLTNDDVHALHEALEQALQDRQQRYAAELARQQALEAKRKEFAAGAQAFVDSLEVRKAEIGALSGEPEPLAAQIRQVYAEGAPERERLSQLSTLQDEMGRLGIVDNRHTRYTIPILDQHNAAFARWVMGRLAQLAVEHDEKSDYAARARALLSWIDQAIPKIEQRDFDNTLEGARQKHEQWTLFKNTERAQKALDKLNVLSLFELTNAELAKSQRPPFEAPAGLAPSDIQTRWSDLEAAEKAYDEAVAEELARQEKLFALARRFDNEVADLEAWATKKEAYLDTVEQVGSLEQAHLRLLQLDVHDEEYKQSQPRVEAAAALQSEISALNYVRSGEVEQRVAQLNDTWRRLADKSAAKRATLLADQEREKRKEELRIEFAEKARAYTDFVARSSDAAVDTSFGLTLEAVTAFRPELDASDAQLSGTGAEQQQELERVWAALQEAGVSDNRHTPLTLASVHASAQQLQQALEERRQRYDEELARQQLLEQKRQEWAALAEQFVAALAERQRAVDELALQGEPAELSQSVRELYQDGRPEEQRVSELTALQAENASLGITENRHTTYSIPMLQAKAQQLGKHVRQLLARLSAELEAKQQYGEQAGALTAWIGNTTSELSADAAFDNTLEGARARAQQFQEWRSSDKAQHGTDRLQLSTLHDKIQASQSANQRPAFVPADGQSPSAVATQWDALEASEKAREQAIETELARQEKLFGIVREFNHEATDVEAVVAVKEAYLTSPAVAGDLDTAHLQLMQLGAFDAEYEALQARSDATRQLAASAASLNYHASGDVTARADALGAAVAHLGELAAQRRAALLAEQAREQRKEDLRVDFANKAKDYGKYVRDTTSSVGDHQFGLLLEDVTAYAAQLDASDAEIGSENDAKRAAIDAVWSDLQASGVTENAHTTQTDADVAANHAAVSDALARRRAAYDAELARLQEDDALRRDWAQKAAQFVEWIQAQRAALDAIGGEPAARFEAVKALHQDGVPGRERLDALSADNTQLQARGVFTNPHTPHTMQTLETLNKLFNDAAATNVAAINEEQEMNERGAAQEAEWKRKEELEEARLDFANRCKVLDGWMENALDVLTDPINVDSVEAVELLQQARAKVEQERTDKTPEYDALVAAEGNLRASGADVSLAPVTDKWNDVGAALQARGEGLANEHARQTANDALCRDFAALAHELQSWIQSETSTLAEVSQGELEAQLPKVQSRRGALSTGKEHLERLGAFSTQLEAADVRANRYTDLTLNNLKAQYGELESAIDSQVSLLQKELLAKKESQASPQQIDEFKEVFAHFDKNNKGALRDFEFKACLNSLGESPSDAELAKLMAELGNAERLITFDRFVDFMIKFASDNITHNEIAESFREIANEKEFVTEEDLRRVLPGDKVDYLVANMPKYAGVDGGFDYRAWADQAFAR